LAQISTPGVRELSFSRRIRGVLPIWANTDAGGMEPSGIKGGSLVSKGAVTPDAIEVALIVAISVNNRVIQRESYRMQ
jgi:hypothetical protein